MQYFFSFNNFCFFVLYQSFSITLICYVTRQQSINNSKEFNVRTKNFEFTIYNMKNMFY